MSPKGQNGAWKMECVESEERMTYEAEINALKKIIKNKDEKIEVTELKRDAELKNHEESTKEMIEKHKKEIFEKEEKFDTEVDKEKYKVTILDMDEKDTIEIQSLKAQLGHEKEKIKVVTDKHCKFVEKLKDRIECPVCLEIPRCGPVYACPNGHFVCKKCKADSCPTCRTDMGLSKSLLVVTILENIDHDCKFVDCDVTSTFDKIDEHVEVCEHNPKNRIVSCPAGKCDERMRLCKLVEHLKDSECCYDSNPVIVKDCEQREAFACGKDKILKTTRASIYVYEDIAFAMTMDKVEEYLTISFVMFTTKIESSKYKVEVSLKGHQDAEESFKFCGAPHSIDEEKGRGKRVGLTVTDEGIRTIASKKNSPDHKFQFIVNFTIVKNQ